MTAAPTSPPVARSALRRFLDALYLGAGYVAACCILLIMVLMIGQSILREMHVRTGAVNDVVSWLCAAAAFFAMAHAFKHGDFVRVTLLLEKVAPGGAARASRSAALAIAAVAVGYLAWWANRFTCDSFVFDETAQGMLPMPMWIPQSTFAIGAILLFVAVVDELVLVAARRPAELRRRGRGAARARRLLGRRLTNAAADAWTSSSSARILLGLMLVLLAGGVWIAMTLAICGWVGQAFFTTTQPGKNLFSAFWESNASWELAALPLFIWMGEILFRTRLSRRDVRRASRRG